MLIIATTDAHAEHEQRIPRIDEIITVDLKKHELQPNPAATTSIRPPCLPRCDRLFQRARNYNVFCEYRDKRAKLIDHCLISGHESHMFNWLRQLRVKNDYYRIGKTYTFTHGSSLSFARIDHGMSVYDMLTQKVVLERMVLPLPVTRCQYAARQPVQRSPHSETNVACAPTTIIHSPNGLSETSTKWLPSLAQLTLNASTLESQR